MGGPPDPFNNRWRLLDGLRAWHDPHDVAVAIGLMLGGAGLACLILVGSFAGSVWMRMGTIDERLQRVESVILQRSTLNMNEDLRNATAAGD